ncbi:hypothetical protein ES332_D04G211500v1 [Gossypium tomentosum]|uniref:Uncharacterized protein n=1 Tax=Gossypium tomentosum TaxID=34277 RepID=A0A5D2LGH4_GOSTO|nr:hypothetical protein ES332_D04G211500v1 [Gossypium tomentosum]
MAVAGQFIVGVADVIAFLLGFVFLVRFWGLSKLKRAASMGFPEENCVNKNGNGEGEGVGTTEIIIVGAGVAGAALAYSLGKVPIFCHLYFNFMEYKFRLGIIIVMNTKKILEP